MWWRYFVALGAGCAVWALLIWVHWFFAGMLGLLAFIVVAGLVAKVTEERPNDGRDNPDE